MIYSRIKEFCSKRGISIYRLEKELGFSSCSICKWNVSVPSAEKLQKVADYFGVPISYFLESEGETNETCNGSLH